MTPPELTSEMENRKHMNDYSLWDIFAVDLLLFGGFLLFLFIFSL